MNIPAVYYMQAVNNYSARSLHLYVLAFQTYSDGNSPGLFGHLYQLQETL